MSRLTPAQIGQHAAAAGFRGAALRNAIAVALAESGGNPRAVGVNSDRWRSRDRGLWQINDHWHPEVSDAAAFDPATAAAHAYRISSKGTDWSPWSTWKNGSAQAQFGRAQMAANQVGAGSSSTAGANVRNVDIPLLPGVPDLPGVPGWEDLLKGFAGGGVGGVTDALAAPFVLLVKAGAWIADPHNWQRVAMVTGGTVGILLALEMIGKSGAAGSTAEAAAAIPGTVRGVAKEAAILATTKGIGKAGGAAKAV